MASAFLILTKEPGHKAMSVVSGYANENHRDTMFSLLKEKHPGKLYIKQNPADNERDDGRRTT